VTVLEADERDDEATILRLATVVAVVMNAPIIGDEVAEVGAAGSSSDVPRLRSAIQDLATACRSVGWPG
jgi:hypothetical protein